MPDTARTLAALQGLLADNAAGDIGAQDVRDFLLSVWAEAQQQTLTNETPAGTGAYEQWGTEELSFGDLSDFTVEVEAHLYGYISLQDVNEATFDTKLQVSFDGGSTWSDSTSTTVTISDMTNTVRYRQMVVAACVLSGAVTGDVQVRAMVQASSLNNGPTWANGVIVAVARFIP